MFVALGKDQFSAAVRTRSVTGYCRTAEQIGFRGLSSIELMCPDKQTPDKCPLDKGPGQVPRTKPPLPDRCSPDRCPIGQVTCQWNVNAQRTSLTLLKVFSV